MSMYENSRSKLPQEKLREYAGQWVAFSLDGARILASGGTIAALEERLLSCGENPQKVAFEWIESEDHLLGGVEIL